MSPPLYRLLFFVVLFWLKATLLCGQKNAVDSIYLQVEATTDPKQKVDLLNQIAHDFYDLDSEQAFAFASQALALAQEDEYLPGARRAFTLKGYYYFVKGKYPEALSFYRSAENVPIPEDDLLAYNAIMKANVFRTLAVYDSAEYHYQSSIAILSRIKSDSYLPFCYKNLGRLYILQWRNDEAEKVIAKAIDIYDKSGRVAGLADAWFSMAEVLRNQAKFEEAARYVTKACEIAQRSNEPLLILHCLMNQGDVKARQGEFPDALKLYIEALGILKSKDLPLMVAMLYVHIADVYRMLGEHDISLKFYGEALKVAERIGIKHDVARIYGFMAMIYKNMDDFPRAYEYCNRSLSLRTEIKDEHGIAQCYNTLGTIQWKEKKYDAAISSLNRALEIRTRMKNREGIASSTYNLSAVYTSQGKLSKALALQKEAIAIEQATGNWYNLGFSNNRLAELYLNVMQPDNAEAHLKEAERIANTLNSQSLKMEVDRNWSRFYEKKGNTVKAYDYFKRYATEKENIYNDIGAQKLAELQALYMMERKDFEIEALKQEKIIQKNQIDLQRSKINIQSVIITSGLAGLALLTLLFVTTFRYNRKIQKANHEIIEQKEEIQAQSEELIDANQTIAEINRKLEEKIEDRTTALRQAYKELDTFFYRSSHDFRRPLTTFMGLAEVAKVTVKDTNALELFEKVKDTAFNLDKMLVKLQSISDVGTQELVYKEVMLKELFETVCDSFRDEIQRRNIKISGDIRIHQTFVSYPAMVRIILENMVENAINFSSVHDPYIRMRAFQDGDSLTLEIDDNGQGIPSEYLGQIFDMYFRANERSKGNGLGLYIVKKAVEKLDGSISVQSDYRVGTTFTILLPMTSKMAGPKF